MENYRKLPKKRALIFDVSFFALNSARTVEQEQQSDLLYMETWCHISWIDDDSSYIAGEESLAVSPSIISLKLRTLCSSLLSSLLLLPPSCPPPALALLEPKSRSGPWSWRWSTTQHTGSQWHHTLPRMCMCLPMSPFHPHIYTLTQF